MNIFKKIKGWFEPTMEKMTDKEVMLHLLSGGKITSKLAVDNAFIFLNESGFLENNLGETKSFIKEPFPYEEKIYVNREDLYNLLTEARLSTLSISELVQKHFEENK